MRVTRALCAAMSAPMLLLAPLAGCAIPAVEPPVQFSVRQRLAEAHLEGVPAPDGGASPAPTRIELVYDLSSYRPPPGVSSVRLRSLRIDVTQTSQPEGDTDCWDFLERATLTIQSARDDSALPPIEIASGLSPGCTGEFVLAPSEAHELLPYLTEGAQIVIDARGHWPTDDVSFVGEAELAVGAL